MSKVEEPISIQDITNYAYIWYKKVPAKLLDFTEKEKRNINYIIRDLTYPSISVFRTIPINEYKDALENELLYLQKKILENGLNDITILQIPRILYDLFNLFYYYKQKLEFKFYYNCKIKIKKIDNFINYSDQLTIKVTDNIFELNNLIITKIYSYLNDVTTSYNIILESIISEINSFDNILSVEKIQVLRDVLDFEKQPNKGYIILYRGAEYDKDSTIRLKSVSDSFINVNSISLNMSVLSGFIGDYDACTLNYITSGTYNLKIQNDKIKYNIKKFYTVPWEKDTSNENSLFFIPPIHPFLQLYCNGELWHPRTKISKQIYDFEYKVVSGLNCNIETFLKNCDYLLSNKTIDELECLYQQYKSTGQINVWQKKYLKYKNKYLELKKIQH